jgi:hypothetical protein
MPCVVSHDPTTCSLYYLHDTPTTHSSTLRHPAETPESPSASHLEMVLEGRSQLTSLQQQCRSSSGRLPPAPGPAMLAANEGSECQFTTTSAQYVACGWRWGCLAPLRSRQLGEEAELLMGGMASVAEQVGAWWWFSWLSYGLAVAHSMRHSH